MPNSSIRSLNPTWPAVRYTPPFQAITVKDKTGAWKVMTVLSLLPNKWGQRSERNSHMAANYSMDNQGLIPKLWFVSPSLLYLVWLLEFRFYEFISSFNLTPLPLNSIRSDMARWWWIGKDVGKIMLYFYIPYWRMTEWCERIKQMISYRNQRAGTVLTLQSYWFKYWLENWLSRPEILCAVHPGKCRESATNRQLPPAESLFAFNNHISTSSTTR